MWRAWVLAIWRDGGARDVWGGLHCCHPDHAHPHLSTSLSTMHWVHLVQTECKISNISAVHPLSHAWT